MVRPHLEDIPTAALPEGFAVRPVDRSSAARQVFDADVKAFRDHWGSVVDDEAAFERFAGDHRTDPSLFVVGSPATRSRAPSST